MVSPNDNKIKAWLDAMPSEVRDGIVNQMSSWLQAMPPDMRSAPMFAGADDEGETLSPEDILEHVRRGTSLGKRLLGQALTNTTVDSLAAAVVTAKGI